MNRGIYLSLATGLTKLNPVSIGVIESLLEAQVTSSTGQQSGFQLRFSLGRSSAVRQMLEGRQLDPRTRIVLSVVVRGVVHVLMDGIVTRQDITSGREPTLTLTGLDLTALLDFVELSDIPYPAMPPEMRVDVILRKYAGFGITPAVVPVSIRTIQNPLEKIDKHQGTDWAYISQLAKQVGFVFYLEPGPSAGASVAYFGPEIRGGKPQPPLSVDMGAATNVESLSFSYDGQLRTRLIGVHYSEKLGLSIPIPLPNLNPLKPTLASSEAKAMHVRFTCLSHKKPEEIALQLLSDTANSADAVSASGELEVARYGSVLAPRRLVSVRGAGDSYNGLYFVTSVTHTLRRGSYRQSFSLVRGGVGSSIGRVSA